MLSVTLLLVLAAVLLFCRCTCEPVLYKKQIVIGEPTSLPASLLMSY